MSPARKQIEGAQHDEATTAMLLEIRKHIVEETVSMNPAFDFEGLDEEVAQALVDLSHYGERSREHLTRYARQRANQFVWLRASNAQYAKQHSNLLTAEVD
ncbi:hypothetical protein [Hyphomicrobium sp. DY-1]|uniref:hypothetical protein n=1 Tax=Hyphomicrobium sp. DY-1 TaxID=3075650 RepID=UPI0039C231D3